MKVALTIPLADTPSTTATAEKLKVVSKIPRTVRCRRCGELAHEAVREHAGGEIAVRYVCHACEARQTRHYEESAA